MLQNVGLERILSVVDRVPNQVIDPRHREFAKGLLRVTVQRVLGAFT